MSDREAWLTRAVNEINDHIFEPFKHRMPEKWAVSCGWAKGSTPKAIGTCVDPSCSADGTTHIFIIPTQHEPLSVLGTLVHEMVHAIVGVKEAHGGKFIELASLLGMKRPWTQCGPVEGTPVHDRLTKIAQRLGPYPHAAVVPRKKPTAPATENRWISRSNPKYGVLISTGSVLKWGRPRDYKGEEMIPKYPEKIFGTGEIDPRFKDMYELPTKRQVPEVEEDPEDEDGDA